MAPAMGLSWEDHHGSARVHRHGVAPVEALLMVRTGQAGADSGADANGVARGDGEHPAALSGEGDGGRDHAGGLDGDQDLAARAGIVAVVVLTVAGLGLATMARLAVLGLGAGGGIGAAAAGAGGR